MKNPILNILEAPSSPYSCQDNKQLYLSVISDCDLASNVIDVLTNI